MLIGITGKKNSGKDTVADYLVRKYKFVKMAFASPVKEICRSLFDLSEKQLNDQYEKEKIDPRWGYSPRQLFQKLGTDWCRDQIDHDIWIYHLNKQFRDSDNIVISDVRFENERKWILENGGVIWRVIRDCDNHDTHVSEQLEMIDGDVIIDNNYDKIELFDQVDHHIIF